MAEPVPMRPELLVRVQAVGRAVVLSGVGCLDYLTAPQFRAHVSEVLGGRPRAVIVDMLRVDFLDSAGIAVIVDTHRDVGHERFAVVAEGPATRRPLHLLGIDNDVSVYRTVGEALASFGVAGTDTDT